MMLVWMARTIVTTILITIAASLLDRGVASLGRPRRWIWGGAMIASVTLPFITLQWTLGHPVLALVNRLFPQVRELVQHTLHAHMLSSLAASNSGVHSIGGASWNVVLLMIWMSASLIGISLFVLVQGWLHARSEHWLKIPVEGIPVFVTPNLGPAVVGVRRPSVLLPTWVLTLPTTIRQVILRHEEEHLRAGDSRLLAGTVLLLALLPWNLALWWQWYRLRMAVETDCDARVLADGRDVREYGEVLLQVSARSLPILLFNPGLGTRGALLKRRILAMTKRPERHGYTKLAALAGAALSASIAAVDASSLLMPRTELLKVQGSGIMPTSATAIQIHGAGFVVMNMPPVHVVPVKMHTHVRLMDTIHVDTSSPPPLAIEPISPARFQLNAQITQVSFEVGTN